MTVSSERAFSSDVARSFAESAFAQARRVADSARGFAKLLLAWLDLFTRAYLGLTFLRIAIRGAVMGIPTTMAVGDGGFFDALLASPFGFTVQALCPVLLLAGIATRLAALPLVIQTLLLVSPESATGIGHVRTALLLCIVVFGPGALSLDRLLGRGLDTSAMPGVALYATVGRAFADKLGPAALLMLRIWIASGPVAVAWRGLGELLPSAALAVIPSFEVMRSPTGGAASVFAAALMLGVGTRATGIALILTLPLAPIGRDGDARLTWALLLCIVVLRGAGPLSLDYFLAALPFRRSGSPPPADLHHVVVVGGGFGGIAAAKALRSADCRVTLELFPIRLGRRHRSQPRRGSFGTRQE